MQVSMYKQIFQLVAHYNDVIMWRHKVSTLCLTVCWGADQRKHQSSASLAFVRGIHRAPVDSPHKVAATRKKFPFYDVIMKRHMSSSLYLSTQSVSDKCFVIIFNPISYFQLFPALIAKSIKTAKLLSETDRLISGKCLHGESAL